MKPEGVLNVHGPRPLWTPRLSRVLGSSEYPRPGPRRRINAVRGRLPDNVRGVPEVTGDSGHGGEMKGGAGSRIGSTAPLPDSEIRSVLRRHAP
jgi:hypothetical protein